jgi:sodium/bile acid cotransporter 7
MSSVSGLPHYRPTREDRHVLARIPFLRRADPFILALLCAVGLATILPPSGGSAVVVDHATTIAVGVLFFLYGTRLSTREALEGAKQWRLHGSVLLVTFVAFPILGIAAHLLVPSVLTPDLYHGLLFLALLPSTVQSSVAFTSIAQGNTAAAICSASFSNVIGVLLTPLLAGLLLATDGGFSVHTLLETAELLLAPFVAGQLLRRWLSPFLTRHKAIFSKVDRGSILLVVYGAFGKGMEQGIWHQVSVGHLLALAVVELALLAIVLGLTHQLGHRLGFAREDRIVLLFCGSKKSLASGLPMATVLFPASTLGLIVLPVMLFHQAQLIACAWLARRYAATAPAPAPEPVVTAEPGVVVATA